MTAQKKPGLTLTKGGMTYTMDEVGSFHWDENEDGSISMTAAPPGVAPPAPAARGMSSLRGSMSTRQAPAQSGDVAGLLRKGAEALVASPRLQEKADELRGKAKESAERARIAAAEREAAENATRGRDPEAEASVEETPSE